MYDCMNLHASFISIIAKNIYHWYYVMLHILKVRRVSVKTKEAINNVTEST